MAMYAETMLVPALPDLIKDFSISYGSSSWILTTFLISGAVMTPISGKLSDVYGRKKILLIILAIYAAGVTLGGFATNFPLMIMVRAMQGMGMSMFPIAFGIIREQFPPAKMAIGQGIITSMFGAGSVIGLLDWRTHNRKLWMASNIFFHNTYCDSAFICGCKIH